MNYLIREGVVCVTLAITFAVSIYFVGAGQDMGYGKFDGTTKAIQIMNR